MLIKFRCPACNHKLRAEGAYAGRRATCGRCKQPVTVPEASTANGDDRASLDDEQPIEPGENGNALVAGVPETTDNKQEDANALSAATAAVAPTPPPMESAGRPPAAVALPPSSGAGGAAAFITFNCPGCGKRIGFPAHLPGTQARCPACRLPVMIPDRSGGESFLIGSFPASGSSSSRPASPRQQIGEIRTHPPRSPAPTPAGHKPATVPAPAGVARGGQIHNTAGQAVSLPSPSQARQPAPRRRLPVWAMLLIGLALLAVIAVGGPWLQRLLYKAGSRASPSPRALAPAAGRLEAPLPAEQPKVLPQAPVPAAPLEPELATPDPIEPLEIRTAPRAPADPPAAVGELLALRDKKHAQDDDDQEQPAKAKTKRLAAAGGLEKQLEKLSTQTPEPSPVEPQCAPDTPKAAARVAPLPLPCEKCMGTRFIPRWPFTPYVFLQKDVPNPVAAVPWQYCPECQRDHSNSALVQAEAERLKTVMDSNRKLEEQTRGQPAYAETHHVTLHAQVPEGNLRQVAGALEKLAEYLEQATNATVLCQTRPGTHEIVVVAGLQDQAVHRGMHARRDDSDERYKQTITIIPGMTPPLENMALFRMGRMFMAEATAGKAPAWLLEGFAAYCENAVTHKNLNYPRTNAPDAIKPGDNWESGLRRLAAQGKLPQLEHLFALSRHNMSPTEYAAAYSFVAFLFKTSPRDFVRYVLEVRGGVASADALDRIYGRNAKEMLAPWAKWAGGSH